MTINSGDVRIKRSQVMLDVADGGGAATATDVPDGVSNAVFLDISETDRALGRVNLRKLFVHVVTDNSDEFLGCNVIIAEQPADPNVSITLFSTGDVFDRRVDAISRIEAYLAEGPAYAGYLYGNHVQGQMTLLIYQKTDKLLPVGTVLVLTKRQGYSDEVQQYVRVTEASGDMQTFADNEGTFQRFIMAVKVSTPLSVDFPGMDMSRYDFGKAALALATKLSETVVADAARYYGSAELEIAGAIGDFTVKAKTIYTQLVPSAQVETPLLDLRTNQTTYAPVASGPTTTREFVGNLKPGANLALGAGILPGSLQLVINGGAFPTITDSRGRLMQSGVEIGQIDYANGILRVSVNPLGEGNEYTFTLTQTPAAVPQSVNQSQGFDITQLNRSLNYVRTIEPAPVRGTLAVSFRAQEEWYVLADSGDGVLRGSTSQQGAGSINFDTGTILVTLGALPDVGSALIFTWVQPTAAREADEIQLDNNGRLYWPFNTSGEVSLNPGAKAIEPGELSIAWGAFTAHDDGAGNIVGGSATGTVNYARGTIRFSPNNAPAPGTPVTVTLNTRAKTTATLSVASGSINFGATNIRPGSVEFIVSGQIKGQYLATGVIDWGPAQSFRITDNAAGVLQAHIGDNLVDCGAINYAAGTATLTGSSPLSADAAAALALWDNIYILANEPSNPVWSWELA